MPLRVRFYFNLTRLSNEVRKEAHEARTLYCVRELTLVPLAYTASLSRHDFTETRQVAPERIRIFIVNRLCIHLAEVTLTINLLLWPS